MGARQSKAQIGGRRRSERPALQCSLLKAKVRAVRVESIAYRDTRGVNEPILEFVNVQQHIDGVELNIDVKLVENRDGNIVLDARLDIERGSERTQVPG